MKPQQHVVLALLQFLSAFAGALCLLLLGGVLGYVEPLWWGGKALFVPYLALEGLALGAIPSYFLSFKFIKLEWGHNAVWRVLCLGFVQGLLFPLLVATAAWVILKGWIVANWLGMQPQQPTTLTGLFFVLFAIFLAIGAIASSIASALLVRTLRGSMHREKA